jgi:hypothetical protein
MTKEVKGKMANWLLAGGAIGMSLCFVYLCLLAKGLGLPLDLGMLIELPIGIGAGVFIAWIAFTIKLMVCRLKKKRK